MEQEHDKGFKDILSEASVFASMVQTFIKADWTKLVKAESLEKVQTSFINAVFKTREADIVYKLKTENVYFYCLLELQSSVDYTMPIRLMVYMSSLWQSILKETPKEVLERKDYKLPVIVPIVLYNGEDKWTAKTEFSQVYDNYDLFKNYALNFKYYLLDVNRYSDRDLLSIGNLIADIFFLDKQSSDKESFTEGLIKKLGEVLPQMKKMSAVEINIFLRWFKAIGLERTGKADQGTRQKIEKMIEEFGKETEVNMFVSNFGIAMEELGREMKWAREMRAKYAKLEAESERTKAQVEKNKAEFEKTKAESEKAKAESEKAKAESEKAKAESEKAKAESEKAKAESEKAKAEIKALKAEIARLKKEKKG
jgi:hypothetical protein